MQKKCWRQNGTPKYGDVTGSIETRLRLGYCLCIRPHLAGYSSNVGHCGGTKADRPKNCEIVDLKSSVMPVVQGFVKTTQQ